MYGNIYYFKRNLSLFAPGVNEGLLFKQTTITQSNPDADGYI
jgi:hypothetical protein